MSVVRTAISVFLIMASTGLSSLAQQSVPRPLYKQESAPIERRLDDLIRRMTLEEKVRQLDMYSGATALVSRSTDNTHADLNATFLPEKAQALWGDLRVGSIHDLNPTPEQSNAIQKWVIAHNRLRIPALFIEEGLHGFDTGTVEIEPGDYTIWVGGSSHATLNSNFNLKP